MKDPTAAAAMRNVEGLKRAAYLVYMNEDGHKARLWLDPATFAIISRNVITLTDENGEQHIRFKEEARDLLQQITGRATTKGHIS